MVVIRYCRFTAYIAYHDSLHVFRAGFSTGNATLKVKLIQQVTAMREEFLHTIFLELHKAYNALDRFRCLDILEGYGVGTRSLRLLHRYWELLRRTLPRRERCDIGGPTVTHHIQCGGVHSGLPLGIIRGGKRGGHQQQQRRGTAVDQYKMGNQQQTTADGVGTYVAEG